MGTLVVEGIWDMDAVLFDLDGTLLDTSNLILRSLRWAVEATGSPMDRLEDFTWGRPLREVLARLCPGREREAFEAYQEHYGAHRHLIVLFPGMRQVLDGLSREGFPLAVVTTKSTVPAREDLALHGLGGLFQAFVGGDDVSRHKPYPEPVLKALDALGADPGRAVMIGDTPGDIEAGRAAGTMTGAVLWGPDPQALIRHGAADTYFRTPTEIFHWCQNGRRWQ